MQPQNPNNNEEHSSAPILDGQVDGAETQNKFLSDSPSNPPSIQPPLQKKRARNWKRDFTFLAIANIIIIIIPATLLYMAPLLGLAYLLVFGILQAIGVGVAVLNIVAISLYLFKRRPRRGAAIFGSIIVIVSAFYVSTFAMSTYTGTKENVTANTPIKEDDALSLINSCQVTSIFRKDRVTLFTKHDPNSQNPSDYARYADNADFDKLQQAAKDASSKCGEIEITDLVAIDNQKPIDITVAEATNLLNSCKLIGFYYTESTSDPSNEFDAEHSSTGIVLGYDNDPLHIHVANRMVATMVPIARAAQQKCPKLQFWHDGKYE